MSCAEPAAERGAIARGAVVRLLLLYLLLTLPGALLRDLWEPDEGRYAEIAREMVVSGDWLVPRINGCAFYEKPPLSYWATAASFTVLGTGSFAARLPVLLAGLGMVLATLAYARRRHGAEVALRSGWLLVISPLFAILFEVVSPDPIFAFFLVAALFDFELAGGPERDRRALWRAWIFLALAMLAKGPLAPVLVAAVLVVYRLARPQFSLSALARPLPMALFVAIVAPWFVAMFASDGRFFETYVVRHHLQRALGSSAGKNLHPKPFYYLIVGVIGAALPATVLLPRALWQALRRRLAAEQIFVLVAWLVPLLLLSASSGKLISYLLPLLPPLAICAALQVRGGEGVERRRWSFFWWCRLWTVALVLLAPWLCLLDRRYSPVSAARELHPYLQPGDRIGCYKRAYPTLLFELERPVTFFGAGGDYFLAGEGDARDGRIFSEDELRAQLGSGQRWYFVVAAHRTRRLLEAAPELREFLRAGEFAVFCSAPLQ